MTAGKHYMHIVSGFMQMIEPSVALSHSLAYHQCVISKIFVQTCEQSRPRSMRDVCTDRRGLCTYRPLFITEGLQPVELPEQEQESMQDPPSPAASVTDKASKQMHARHHARKPLSDLTNTHVSSLHTTQARKTVPQARDSASSTVSDMVTFWEQRASLQ